MMHQQYQSALVSGSALFHPLIWPAGSDKRSTALSQSNALIPPYTVATSGRWIRQWLDVPAPHDSPGYIPNGAA
jgi:hypothetical protein